MAGVRLCLVVVLLAWLRAVILPFVLLFRGADYRLGCALGEDKAWNALLAGNPNEYLSSRAFRTGWVWRQRLINWIFSDPRHCEDSFLNELNRINAPKEYRSWTPPS